MDQIPAAMDRHLEVIQCHTGKRVFSHIYDVFVDKLRKTSCKMKHLITPSTYYLVRKRNKCNEKINFKRSSWNLIQSVNWYAMT